MEVVVSARRRQWDNGSLLRTTSDQNALKSRKQKYSATLAGERVKKRCGHTRALDWATYQIYGEGYLR